MQIIDRIVGFIYSSSNLTTSLTRTLVLSQDEDQTTYHPNLNPPLAAHPSFGTSLMDIDPPKLNLILDLDHTLLHSIHLYHLTREEQYLITTNPYRDLYAYGDVVTKLRPHVGIFLHEASKMFELHIYTKGSRRYANQMATFLDPKREYFASSSRVLSSQDHGIFGEEKNLDAAVGCKCWNSVILDDTLEAWSRINWGNLILAEKYYFFKDERRWNKSHAELRTDEVGFFDQVLRFLKEINRRYSDAVARNPYGVDVRDVV